MSGETSIEWTNKTWNPWWGCQKVSAGCKHCYAEGIANRFNNGVTIWGGSDSTRKMQSDSYWTQPIKWNEKAEEDGTRPMVFPSMCDPFEDRDDLIQERERFLKLIRDTPNLIWQILTKRPENINKMWPSLPFNVWIGTSIENQEAAEKRMPHLCNTAAIHMISFVI